MPREPTYWPAAVRETFGHMADHNIPEINELKEAA
jgi:hypothetical protein